MDLRPHVALALAGLVFGCAEGLKSQSQNGDDTGVPGDDSTLDGDESAPLDSGAGDVGFDLTPQDVDTGPLDACASTSEEATTKSLPVDIVWMVDNSASMAPAVAQVTKGLNDFVAVLAGKSLDYEVVMLSLKSDTSPITVGGSTRYPVCIPPPLAGDTHCNDGPHFHQSSIDIKSTQPLEQFLGTLAQTTGYTPTDIRGGDPWASFLRPDATKTIVVVSDDNSRLTSSEFETFAGGTNPYNPALVLPPGILDVSWKGLFDGYVFDGLYGWGSDTDDGIRCTYSDGTFPAASGITYSELVKKTGGVRAKICDGDSAWGPFFDAIASAVVKASKLACTLDIPVPSSGTLDPAEVNVQIDAGGTTTIVPKTTDATTCGTDVAWYYDDDAHPTKVILCPAACDLANADVGVDKPGKIDILFGCKTIVAK